MVLFVLAKSNRFTIENYKKRQGQRVSHLIKIVLYNKISELDGSECSAIIFGDLERLSAAQRKLIVGLCDEIKSKYPELPIYNDPGLVMNRFDLLRHLYESKSNHFNVHRLSEPLQDIRYPVFIREENEHTGALSELIWNFNKLSKNVIRLFYLGYSPRNLLIVEFCDVSDENQIYHKFTAYKIGKHIMARRMDWNEHWVVKANRQVTQSEKWFVDSLFYLNNNPHKKWLNDVFEKAHINYGRADYALLGEKEQLWEININPSFGGNRVIKGKRRPELLLLRDKHHDELAHIFEQMAENKVHQLYLQKCTEIESQMSSDMIRDLWRTIHMWMETQKPPYRQLVQLIQITATVLSNITCFLKPLRDWIWEPKFETVSPKEG